MSFLDREAGLRAQSQDVDHRAELVGAVVLPESAGEPETSVVATDLRTTTVNRATELREFI
jgi:hypothetical protein